MHLAVWTVVPFVLMLLAIAAVCPLAVPHWWERNDRKLLVSVVLGAPILILYLMRRPGAIVAMAEELPVVHRAARRSLRHRY